MVGRSWCVCSAVLVSDLIAGFGYGSEVANPTLAPLLRQAARASKKGRVAPRLRCDKQFGPGTRRVGAAAVGGHRPPHDSHQLTYPP